MDQGFSEVEGKLSREIAALFDLGVSELKNRWRFVYGTEPPPRSSRKLLASAIAYICRSEFSAGSSPQCAACLSARPRMQVATFRVPNQSQEPLPARF
jgi:hypothetical protein